MTDTSAGELARRLADAPDIDTYLALEAEAGDRFAALETAAAAVLGCAFAGRAPVYARARKPPVFTPAVPTSALVALETAFDIGAQQQRGAWWLPEQLSVKWGTVNVPAYYRDHPSWAMTRAGDDAGKFPTCELAVFACWAVLGPLADDLFEPLTLRGPDNGALEPAAAAARWAAVADRYRALGLHSDNVMAALEAMTPGHGWSRLDAPGQVAAKQRLLDALARAVTAGTVRRWRVGQVRELTGRYVAKSKRGPAESRAVLVKASQPTLAAWFGGDWLALLDYLGEMPAEGEVIQTALPAPRLYVEGSAKVQQVAREKKLPTEQVAAMLASYLGSDAVHSPVQRRAAVIRSWWDALDAAQAVHQPGMDPLDLRLHATIPGSGTGGDPFTDPTESSWLPPTVRDDIWMLWGGLTVQSKPERIVSALSPLRTMRAALGPGLDFWYEIALSCWYLCEGPYARTELSGLRSYYRKHLQTMADADVPADPVLFTELEQAEARLGPPEPMLDRGDPIDIGHGVSMSFSVGNGVRRAGYEILRDILTRHRRAWARQYLDAAVRAGWERPLRELADDINQAIAAKGKLPTTRQLARMAETVTNAWFGGDLAATLATVGEHVSVAPVDARILPADRYAYCRRVYQALGGEPRRVRSGDRYWASTALIPFAANAPRLIQKYELLGRPPSAEEAGYGDRFRNWPEGLNWDRYLQVVIDAVHKRDPATAGLSSASVPAGDRRPASAPHPPRAEAQAPSGSTTAPPSAATSTALAAGWHLDPIEPGGLRWWDGQGWTGITAPAPGACGWFSDPERADQVRWYDGDAWTDLTAPAPPPPERRPVRDLPPWEVPGLPCGLTDADFAAARDVAAALTQAVSCGEHHLEPARGAWAAYQHTYGTGYPHNQARLRALTQQPPLGRTDDGWSVYPAIFVADPSPSDTDARPVGACAQVGYIGSVWSHASTSWASRLPALLSANRFVVTRVAVAEQRGEIAAQVWVPALDLPPWHRLE